MKTILLVEDDPFLIDIYSTQLNEAGFQVEIAKDGEECLTKITEKKPDLLILDMVLPKMSGWEVLREIQKNENLKDLKIVVLSNLSQKREVDESMRLGVTKYLIKAHYTPSQIVTEIKKIFA